MALSSKGVLVDSNLLLLLIADVTDRARVTCFRRTKHHSLEDCDGLIAMFGSTDTALLASAEDLLLLPDDGRCATFASSQGVKVLDLQTALELQRHA